MNRGFSRNTLLILSLYIFTQGVWAFGYPALPEVPFQGVGVSHMQMRDQFSVGLGPITPSALVNSGNPGVDAVRLGPANALGGVNLFAGTFGATACGTNGVAAACAFRDATNIPNVGYHYEGLFHRPLGQAALQPYNVRAYDGFGNIYTLGIVGHDPGETAAFHLLTPPGVDGLPGGLLGQDVGVGRAAIWWNGPGVMDANLWAGEGIIPNAAMVGAGWTPFFAGRLWFRSYSEIDFVENGVQGADTYDFFLDSGALEQFHPELFNAVVAPVPVPAGIWLLGSALASLTVRRRKVA